MRTTLKNTHNNNTTTKTIIHKTRKKKITETETTCLTTHNNKEVARDLKKQNPTGENHGAYRQIEEYLPAGISIN